MAEFERKRREWEETAEAKTAKNRAKRQKKKERARGKAEKDSTPSASGPSGDYANVPLKKRRLVNGAEMVFRRPGEESSDEDDEGPGPAPPQFTPDDDSVDNSTSADLSSIPVVDAPRIIIHEDD